MSWAGNRLLCCLPTSYGGTTVHGPLCETPEKPLSSDEYAIYRAGRRELAAEFNRKAWDDARRRASRAAHPAGKAPRYRASGQWVQCRCHVPMAAFCPVHRGHA